VILARLTTGGYCMAATYGCFLAAVIVCACFLPNRGDFSAFLDRARTVDEFIHSPSIGRAANIVEALILKVNSCKVFFGLIVLLSGSSSFVCYFPCYFMFFFMNRFHCEE
jgi:hypothetical protein